MKRISFFSLTIFFTFFVALNSMNINEMRDDEPTLNLRFHFLKENLSSNQKNPHLISLTVLHNYQKLFTQLAQEAYDKRDYDIAIKSLRFASNLDLFLKKAGYEMDID